MQIRDGFQHQSAELAEELRDYILSKTNKDNEQMSWRLTHRTLRIAATSWGLWYDWTGSAPLDIIDPSTVLRFRPISDMAPVTVSLVVLAASRSDMLLDLLDRHASHFHDVVVMLDAKPAIPVVEAKISFHCRPLAGDFGAQRNAGNVLAQGAWTFHLDTDERLEHAFCSILPSLAGAAEKAGLRAVGFPRNNFVDDTLSDLFPDVQYRLMRRDVRMENRVHERPVACRRSGQTTVSQHGTIDHYLRRTRVQERSALYDKLGQSPARHADATALLRPFEGLVRLSRFL